MPSRSLWPRELIFATPSPDTAQGSRASLCPCAACFQSPSPSPSPASPAALKAPSARKKTRKHRQSFLGARLGARRSFESVASDMVPLASAGQSPASSGDDESGMEADAERT